MHVLGAGVGSALTQMSTADEFTVQVSCDRMARKTKMTLLQDMRMLRTCARIEEVKERRCWRDGSDNACVERKLIVSPCMPDCSHSTVSAL